MYSGTLLAYPDFNEDIEINTDSNDIQLWEIIRQKVKPITFNNKKTYWTSKEYIVTEWYLLRKFENLKEFRTILIGQILGIYTYSKNLKIDNFNINIVLRWRLIFEEYGPEIEHIKGEKYI